jgi:hypothetical protein
MCWGEHHGVKEHGGAAYIMVNKQSRAITARHILSDLLSLRRLRLPQFYHFPIVYSIFLSINELSYKRNESSHYLTVPGNVLPDTP